MTSLASGQRAEAEEVGKLRHALAEATARAAAQSKALAAKDDRLRDLDLERQAAERKSEATRVRTSL